MKFPTLYIADKSGKIRYWNISVRDSTIVRQYGQEGGKEITTERTIQRGKNIGKKNETTPQEQAVLEARSTWTKQKDLGYSESRDVKPCILPMLANKWDDKKHYISVPFAVQPKLDGVRMLVGRQGDKIFAMSRTGKTVNFMDHIVREVEGLLQDGDMLDGENFTPDKSFEEITGMCRTSLESTAKTRNFEAIHFHVFDYFNLKNPDEPYGKRYEKLGKLFERRKPVYTHVVPTQIVDDKSKVQRLHDEYVAQGHEGIMIRDFGAPYSISQRSNFLLKHKNFQTEEYPIVGHQEAQGKDKGTVIWTCRTKKGQDFSVRPKGTFENRKRWHDNAEAYMGKLLTVQFQNLTTDGIPRFPVGIALRDYE